MSPSAPPARPPSSPHTHHHHLLHTPSVFPLAFWPSVPEKEKKRKRYPGPLPLTNITTPLRPSVSQPSGLPARAAATTDSLAPNRTPDLHVRRARRGQGAYANASSAGRVWATWRSPTSRRNAASPLTMYRAEAARVATKSGGASRVGKGLV